jgi:hypothetical protein
VWEEITEGMRAVISSYKRPMVAAPKAALRFP